MVWGGPWAPVGGGRYLSGGVAVAAIQARRVARTATHGVDTLVLGLALDCPTQLHVRLAGCHVKSEEKGKELLRDERNALGDELVGQEAAEEPREASTLQSLAQLQPG